MRKMKPDLEDMRVETFEVLPRRATGPGTIVGRMDAPAPEEEDDGTTTPAQAGEMAGKIANGIVTNYTRSCIPWCLSFVTCAFCSC